MSFTYQKKEEFLIEDENMIVGQITSVDTGFQNFVATNASTTVSVPVPVRQFTELEDWVIHSLDLLSPFDADFIHEHMKTRSVQSITDRLNSQEFRKKALDFKKVPLFTFELIFIRDRIVVNKTLMMLTSKELIPLKCKRRDCEHTFGLPRAQLSFSPKSPYGFETSELCQFIAENAKKEHLPYLRRNIYTMEEFLDEANIDFRNITPSGDNQPTKMVVTLDSLKHEAEEPLRIDAAGRVFLNARHDATLKKIVKAVGKNRWEDTTQLLLACFDHEIDFDAEDIEIYKRIAGYYRHNLDPDMKVGTFATDEDKCIMFLYKAWHKTMQGDNLWNHIARHMKGRTAPQVKNRFLRTTQDRYDITLDNMKNFPDDLNNPATYNYNNAHVFSLTIFPKSSTTIMDITTKLQHEVRFLVAGTPKEIFLLPCKYTAVRCTHMGMEQHKFTYDPDRPAEQFLTYVKLTYTNSLKKAKIVDAAFHHSDIDYVGEGIHEIMSVATSERFVVPKEEFMRLNRRQVAATTILSPHMASPGGPRFASPGVVRPGGPIPVTVNPRPRGSGRGRPRGSRNATPRMQPPSAKRKKTE